jgi:hypothetical protein
VKKYGKSKNKLFESTNFLSRVHYLFGSFTTYIYVKYFFNNSVVVAV